MSHRTVVLSSLIFICCETLLFASEPLPGISPAIVDEVQRLAVTLRLAEFPIHQTELKSYLSLPPYQNGLGEVGKGMKARALFKLSDSYDPLGFYGLYVYYGKRQSDGSPPLIENAELVFFPGNLGNFPPTAAFVLNNEGGNPEAIRMMRKKMHESNMTPGDFIKARFKKN